MFIRIPPHVKLIVSIFFIRFNLKGWNLGLGILNNVFFLKFLQKTCHPIIEKSQSPKNINHD